VYVDTLQPELKPGDWWPNFGMYIDKEFSIVSKMGSGRYIDVVDNNLVIKTRSSSQTQKWKFDYNSRTVMNVGTKKSMSIQNSGTGSNINVWTTTSEWFQIFRFT